MKTIYPKRRGALHILKKTVLTVLAVICVFAFFAAALGTIFVVRTAQKAPDITSLTVAASGSASYILDSEGKALQKLSLPESNRDLVTIIDVPEDLKHAFIAVEDSRFYQHNGVDIPGIIRAIVSGVFTGHFDQGASTITQQLLKNTVFTDWMNEDTFY